MPGPVEIRVSANWKAWERGLGSLGQAMGDRGRTIWQQATDVMFDRSQQYAHVLSGDNKESGSAETVVDGNDLVGRITYDSDHAIYEEARGGEHAYLGRAWEATQSTFERAMPKAWKEITESWR